MSRARGLSDSEKPFLMHDSPILQGSTGPLWEPVNLPYNLLCSKTKSDELFLRWLALPETVEFLEALSQRRSSFSLSLVHPRNNKPPRLQLVKNGKNYDHPTNPPPRRLKEETKPTTREERTQFRVGHPKAALAELFTEAPISRDLAIFCGFPDFFGNFLVRKIDKKEVYHDFVNSPVIKIERGDLYEFWDTNVEGKDEPRLLFDLLRQPKNDFIAPEDLCVVFEDLLACHPGLKSVQIDSKAQSCYVDCVIAQVFWTTSRHIRDRIHYPELKANLQFIHALYSVLDTPDLDKVPFFNLSVFKRLSHRFESMTNKLGAHLTVQDLSTYYHHLNRRALERAYHMSKFPIKHRSNLDQCKATFGFSEFVWFSLALNRRTEKAQRFWFSCCDVDGDGYLGINDLYYFYEYQVYSLEAAYLDGLEWGDVLSQIFDVVRPSARHRISWKDLDRSKAAEFLFNILLDANKFQEFAYSFCFPPERKYYDDLPMENESGSAQSSPMTPTLLDRPRRAFFRTS